MYKKTIQFSCLLLMAPAITVTAAPRVTPEVPEGRTWLPYLYSGATYDDNVFRVADEQEARDVTGGSRMSDTRTLYGLGLKMHKPISLQTLRLDAAIERVNYQNFDNLDHTAGHALGAWDWEVGRMFDGTISHRYERGISSFTEFQQAARDIRKMDESHISGGYNFLTAWRLELGAERREIEYEKQTFLDREEETGFAELLYATSVNTRVGLRAAVTDADLEPLAVAGTPTNFDYEESSYGLVVGWEGTAKSYLQVFAGYTRRDQDDPDQRDFSGATGRLTHRWGMTPLTSLETSVFREVNALDYQIATFVVSDGVSTGPVWQVTPDTRLRGQVSYQRDDFEGPVVTREGTVVTDAGREDKVFSAGTRLEYQAITDLLLSLAVDYRDRDSNRDDSDYDNTQVTAEFSYAF